MYNNLNDYIITILFKSDDSIKVLNKINLNEKKYLRNIEFQNLKLNNNSKIEEFTNDLKEPNLFNNESAKNERYIRSSISP